MVRPMRQAVTAVAAIALTLGATPTLLAQDTRVEVKVVVPGEVFRQVQQIVETTVGPQVRAEITQAIREAVVELSTIGREVSREVSREVQRGRNDRDQDRQEEIESEQDGDEVNEIGAEGIQLAVSEVDDAHDAEDEGQSNSQQRVCTAQNKHVDDMLKKFGHANTPGAWSEPFRQNRVRAGIIRI